MTNKIISLFKRQQEYDEHDTLLLAIQEGDKDALRELFDLCKQSVYGYAYSIIKNPQDAQDIVQDVFIQIYKSAHLYKPESKAMAWIFTITRNITYMKIRKQQKETLLEEREDLENLYDVDVHKEEGQKIFLQQVLSKLDEQSRQIVVLHALEGLLHKEIAAMLDMKLSTVLSKYNRAIKKLQELVKEEYPHE